MAQTLHLVIPGLLGPWPQANEQGFPQPKAPALEQLLRRAKVAHTGITGLEATLFDLLKIQTHAQSRDDDLPAAAVTALADGYASADGWWMRADPVHLHADLHQVLLFDARHLDIDDAEAQALVTAFNHTFTDLGGTLTAPHPTRWYLRLDAPPRLRTYSIGETIGHNINLLLPYGPDSQRWHTLLTEIQMLFHANPVNLKREIQQQLPINSVWFWGGGYLPKADAATDSIYSATTLAKGLALLTDAKLKMLPISASDWHTSAAEDNECLVVFDGLEREAFDWSAQIDRLEKDWFAPLLALLRRQSLQLVLYPDNGLRFTCSRATLRRFWQRPRALAVYLKNHTQ